MPIMNIRVIFTKMSRRSFRYWLYAKNNQTQRNSLSTSDRFKGHLNLSATCFCEIVKPSSLEKSSGLLWYGNANHIFIHAGARSTDPLCITFLLRKHGDIFSFSILAMHWDGTGRSNPFFTEDKYQFNLCCQYQGCWWHGNTNIWGIRSQNNSSASQALYKGIHYILL